MLPRTGDHVKNQSYDQTRQPWSATDRLPKSKVLRLQRRWLVILAMITAGGGVAAWGFSRDRPADVYRYEVIHEFPHDAQAFCQGLVFEDGILYEGTGSYGKSCLRKIDLDSGKVLQQVNLNRRLFGEGITIWKDKLIQLTWKSHIGIVYDKNTFAKTETFRISGEGWGLTHDDQHLIISDGSSTLRFINPETYKISHRLAVNSQGRRVKNLNELEFWKGEILANIWKSDMIARIDPQNGHLLGWIDLSGLKPVTVRQNREAVLNGIAYDTMNQRLFVTGKHWPKLFEIRITKTP